MGFEERPGWSNRSIAIAVAMVAMVAAMVLSTCISNCLMPTRPNHHIGRVHYEMMGK
jgi:hypothetical protein